MPDGPATKELNSLPICQQNNILLAPVTEPHFKASTKLNCPNYFVYSNDRDNTPGGGRAIVVRKVIKHSELLLLILQHTEATAIQISINK